MEAGGENVSFPRVLLRRPPGTTAAASGSGATNPRQGRRLSTLSGSSTPSTNAGSGPDWRIRLRTCSSS